MLPSTERDRFWLILLSLLAVYGHSLWGDYLHYDDVWLIRDNAFFKSPTWSSLGSIWFDTSSSTRLLLGAEYLPLRDTSVLLDIVLFGTAPQPMRVVNLSLYLLCGALCLLSLRKYVRPTWLADISAALFLLHPAHVESVAWIVGRKDLLGLVFFWAAALLYQSKSSFKSAGVAALLVLAQLSKFLFISAPLLLLILETMRTGAAPTKKLLRDLLVWAIPVFSVAMLQLAMARETGMVPEAGPSYHQQLLTMGPVWWGYLKSALFGTDLSIVHDVVPQHSFSLQVLGGYCSLAIVPLLLLLLARRCRGSLLRPWLAYACFIFPLVPASHLLAPIQNYQEDRYLLLSVLGVSLLWAELARWTQTRSIHLTKLGGALLFSWFCLNTGYRAHLFTSGQLLFEHATRHTSYSAEAPYQLGVILEEQGELTEALRAYHQALSRPDFPSAACRKATNNLGRLYARLGQLPVAENIYRRGTATWPQDPKLALNLAEIVWRSGREEEAKLLYEGVLRRFAGYQLARQNYQQHFPDSDVSKVR